MKCEDFEKLILLAGSGELSPGDGQALESHLSACADCRRYREEVVHLTRLAASALPSEPASFLVPRILAHAGAETRRGQQSWFPVPRFHILALAASLLVAVCVWVVSTSEGTKDPITDMHTLATVMSSEMETEVDNQAEQGAAGEDALRKLALELLRVEGFTADETEEQASSAGGELEADA